MRVQCPCGKGIKVPDHLAGKKFRCPACNKILLAQDEDVPEEDLEPEEEEAISPTRARKKARPEPEEDDEEDRKPTPKKKGTKKGKKRTIKTGPSPVLIGVFALVGVILLAGGGVTAYLLTRPGKTPDSQANKDPQKGSPSGPGGQPMGPGGQPMGPGGQPMGPGGQPMGPGGQPMGPAGQPMGPGGQPMGPGGQPVGPGRTPSAEETKETKIPEGLQGAWGWSGVNTLDGKMMTSTPKKPCLTITGNKAEWSDLFDLKNGKGTITVDTTAMPPRIDIKTENVTYKGVYRYSEKDKYLSITFAAPGGDYPKEVKFLVEKGKEFNISFSKIQTP